MQDLIPKMTSNTAPSGVASANRTWSTYSPWKAMNDTQVDQSDMWLDYPFVSGDYLKFAFPSPVIPLGYSITTRAGSMTPYAPKAWTCEWSADDAAWDTLDTQSGITDWAALNNEKKIFVFPNATEYNYVRLVFTESNYASYLAIGEFEVYDTIIHEFVDSGVGIDLPKADKVVLYPDNGVGQDAYSVSYPYPLNLKRKLLIIRGIK